MQLGPKAAPWIARWRTVFLVLWGIFGSCVISWGQVQSSLDETDTRAVMKANFLFHFAASNEWPASVKTGPFNLAIIGNDRLYEELVDKYALKMVGAQPLKIQAYPDVASYPLQSNSHLVYCEIGGVELQKLAKALEPLPVLLVADSPGALERGAFINFVAMGNRIRYEINAVKAGEKGVLIGNKIMSWAVTSTP